MAGVLAFGDQTTLTTESTEEHGEMPRLQSSAAIESVLAAFDTANLVALAERHWAKEDSRFRLQLIRSPSFPGKVNDIVVEFANPLYQSVLDGFINGDAVPADEVQQVWQNTSHPGAFDSPVYEEFLKSVRELNRRLSRDGRVRVLAADYPVDWRAVSTAADLEGAMSGRDEFAAGIIRREVLDKKRTALVIFGSAHLYRNRPDTIVDLLRGDARAKWFVVVPSSGPGLPDLITANEAGVNDPALLNLDGTPLGLLAAAEVLEMGSKRLKTVDGKPVFRDGKPILVPAFEDQIKLGELADACLYFGAAQPEFVPPSAELYDGKEYGKEVERRRRIVQLAWPRV